MAAENINELIYQLNDDDDWEVRQKAADRLAMLGAEAADALDALWSRIAVEDDTDVLESIAEAISFIEKDRGALLAGLSKSVEHIRNDDNYVDSDFFLTFVRKARFQPAETQAFLDSVWQLLAKWNEREYLAEAFTIISELTVDGAAALKRLVTADGVDDWKKSYLLFDYDFRDKLNRGWEDVRATLLPLAAIALDDEDSDRRDEAASWLAEQAASFTDEERAQVLEALWGYLRKHNRGFAAIVQVGGRTVAIERLMGEEEIEKSAIGGMLLTEASDALDELWEKDEAATLELVLGALNLEGWEERQAAVDWLVVNSASFSEAQRDRVLGALWSCLRKYGQGFNGIISIGDRAAAIDRLIGDNQIRRDVVGGILLIDAEDELSNLLKSDTEKALVLVLAALDHEDWTVRQAAAEWLRDNGGEFRGEQVDTAIQALEQLRDTEYDPDVQRSIEAALVNFRKLDRAVQLGPLLQILREEEDEDTLVETVDQVLKVGSVGAARALVREWVQWIASRDKPLLVETSSEQLRVTDFVVRPLIEQFEKRFQPSQDLLQSIAIEIEDTAPESTQEWLAALVTTSEKYALLRRKAEENNWSEDKLRNEVFKYRVADEVERLGMRVHRRIARQFSEMSDERFFENENICGAVQEKLRRYAVPVVARRLPKEEDLDTRESLSRMLGNIGGRESVDALTRAVVGEERTRAERQELLAKYYLEPSKTRSEEASMILKGAVAEARNTLRILQVLNISVFAVGLVLLTFGLITSMTTDDAAQRVVGAVAGLGGFAGVIAQLIRDPLDRIQNAMANLVQIETAFTSFIWELNLNGTFIQSQYVSEGILTDDAISQTIGRIEDAMNLAMSLVAIYTEEGGQRLVTRVHKLSPAAGPLGETVVLYGQHLQGDSSQKKERGGLVAVNHTPIQARGVDWGDHTVQFELPEDLPGLADGQGTIWISLLVDGMETNSLPFHVVNGQD